MCKGIATLKDASHRLNKKRQLGQINGFKTMEDSGVQLCSKCNEYEHGCGRYKVQIYRGLRARLNGHIYQVQPTCSVETV